MKQANLPTLEQFKIKNKLVLIRSDFNVPIQNGKIIDETRIKEGLKTIEYCLNHQAKVLLISHLGRPNAGEHNQALSLKPIATRLSELLNQEIEFIKDWKSFDFRKSNKPIFLLENIRFESGETSCDNNLSRKLANLADLVVIDAFGSAHRKHSSTYGAVQFSSSASAGLLLQKEIESLNQALVNPVSPILAIVGGAKVSTKLEVLDFLIDKVNHLILGGGIINTFLLAKGYPIGHSLAEPDLVKKTLNIIDKAKQKSVQIHLPTDVVTTQDFNHPTSFQTKAIDQILADDIIMDVGDKSARELAKVVSLCRTILWNGPLGVFEHPQFANGTKKLTEAICKQTQKGAFSIAGGGDTIAAINQFDAFFKISYISTGGGAFLEFIEGKKLPVIDALNQKLLKNKANIQ